MKNTREIEPVPLINESVESLFLFSSASYISVPPIGPFEVFPSWCRLPIVMSLLSFSF